MAGQTPSPLGGLSKSPPFRYAGLLLYNWTELALGAAV